MRFLVAILLAVAALPGAIAKEGAESTVPAWEASVSPSEVDTVLYFHPVNLRDMPLNTQTPTYEEVDDSSYGVTAMTLTCLHPMTGNVGGTGVGTGGTTSQAYHTYRSYSSPSYVEYDYTAQDGAPRTHPERGLGYDIPLNETTPFVLHWFLGEEAGLQADGADVPTVLTNVVVQVTMREGDAISIDDKAYDSGDVILAGATAPVTATAGQVGGPGAAQVTASQVDGQWVYDFAVPLTLQKAFLNRSTGFTVRLDVLVDNPVCQEGAIMPSTVEVIADPRHQPRIELRNAKPLQVDYAAAYQGEDGEVRLLWSVNSGWGNYDVDVANATLQVFGPVDVAPLHAYTIQRLREAYHHLEPVSQGWTVDASDLPDGRYTAVFAVPNLQHTATAEARVDFFVQDGKVVDHEPTEAPAPGALLLLASLAIAAAVALRRRA